MHMNSSRRLKPGRWMWVIVPLLVSLAVMLPRLISPHFNFEDDGISIQTARQVLKGDFSSILVDFTHRFRPLYWLGFVPLYFFGRGNPFWYFLSNTLILAAIVACIAFLVRRNGGTKLQASLAGTLFALSGPAIETFYTVSKPEHVQLLCLLLSLLLISELNDRPLAGKIIVFFLMMVTVLYALLVKETSLVILPIGVGWLTLKAVLGHADKPALARLGIYTAAASVASLIYLTLDTRLTGGPLAGQGYGGHYTLAIGFMLFMAFAWAGWLIRDFLGLAFSALLLLIPRLRATASRSLLAASAVWMAGWLAIFLPWDRTDEYYLLPLAAGWCIFCATLLGEAVAHWNDLHTGWKMAAASSLALFAAFTLITQLNNYSNARLELVVDRQQSKLMAYLDENTTDRDLILANFPANDTFFSHALALMQTVGGRPNIQVQPFRFQSADPGTASISYDLVTAQSMNKPLFAVRSQGDNSKSNNALAGILGPSRQPVYDDRQGFRLLSINLINLVCPFVRSGYLQDLYCRYRLPVIDTRPYSYGWRVYRISSSVNDMALPAVFDAGSWELQLPDGSTRSLEFGSAGDTPLAGDWTGNGRTGIGVFDPRSLTWSLDSDLDGRPDITFQLHGMTATDIPLTGDWDCQGRDAPGYFRPSDGSWHFWTADYSQPEDLPVLSGTETGVLPLVGDWNGDGCDTIGIYRPEKGEVNLENKLTVSLAGADFYAPKNSIPVVADWSGTGIQTLAFFDAGEWTRLYANCDCPPANPALPLHFGDSASIPLAGKWPSGK